MRVTRQDFEAFAASFKLARPTPEMHLPGGPSSIRATHKLEQWTYDVVLIADVLATGNAKFDRKRFYAACGAVTA